MHDTPLRVILNDRPLRQSLTGVGHYIRQLVLAVRELERDARVYLDPVLFPDAATRNWRRASEPARKPGPPASVAGSRAPWFLRRIIQGAYAIYFRRRARGCALYHEPNHIPIRCDLPTVTTVHDLSVLVHPEWHPRDRVRWYEREFRAGVNRTTRFIAASEFTKREMIARLAVSAGRIDVTYQAARPAFKPQQPAAAAAVRGEFDLPPRFFLFVGTLEPRKNVTGLLNAFAALPAGVRRELPLVIVGAWGWKREALAERLRERALGDEVRLLGYATDEKLAALYTACTALIWPTFYEGFGLPPLEAMACGTAVITSNAASLPEVVGDAGLLLDPLDPPAWTAALRRAAEDEPWRSDLAHRGLAQAARFSWRRCAEQTIACYRSAVASG